VRTTGTRFTATVPRRALRCHACGASHHSMTVTARRWSFTARAWCTGGRLTGSQQDIDGRVSGVQRTLDGRELRCSCGRRVDEVPDAVSPSDPLFWLALLEVITEWRNGFGRTPSPGHRGTHTRWSVIARCRSQRFARESIVIIIHYFSCIPTHIHIICCILCLLQTKYCLSSFTTRVPVPVPLLVSYSRLSHRLISRYLPSPANPTATDTSSSIRCLLQRQKLCQSRIV